MNEPVDFLVQLLSQFAGGPGPPENNLVRFGLAALFWGVLLVVAWTRQSQQARPRERLLVVGFALALARELFMFSQQAWRIRSGAEHDALCTVTAPLEHSLTLVALLLIAGSFLRYLLDDDRITRTYLRGGLGAVGLLSMATFLWWPGQLAANPSLHFSTTWPAWALHLLAAVLLVIAFGILARRRGWIRNVVLIALLFFITSETLTLLNLATAREYSRIICPIGNSFYLWAIPLFGFVYFREQSLEKKRAEEALEAYQNHLEELVEERTAQAQAQLERAAALEERQRIATTLHDGLAQTLSYIGIISSHTESMLSDGNVVAAREGFTRMHSALSQAIDEARTCISSLQEVPIPPQGLACCLEEELDQLAIPHGPQIRFVSQLADPVTELPECVEHVRRVVREAVMNALQHAEPSQIVVTLNSTDGRGVVSVEDDGRGFELGASHPDGRDHFGLSIMKARSIQLAGELIVDSSEGAGTRVILTWPLNDAGRAKPDANWQERVDHAAPLSHVDS